MRKDWKDHALGATVLVLATTSFVGLCAVLEKAKNSFVKKEKS